jgi:hypothetical protein
MSQRTRLWSDCIRAIRDYPTCGMGMGAYTATAMKYVSGSIYDFHVDHAHCEFLELAAEAGVAMALVVVLALGVHFVQGVRAALRMRGPESILLCGFLGALVAALVRAAVDFDFHLAGSAVVLAAVLGAVRGVTRDPSRAGWPLRYVALALVGSAIAVRYGCAPSPIGFRSVEAAWAQRQQLEQELDLSADANLAALTAEDRSGALADMLRRAAASRVATDLSRARTRLIEAYRVTLRQEPADGRAHAMLAILLAEQGADGTGPDIDRHARLAVELYPRGYDWHLRAIAAVLRMRPDDDGARRRLAEIAARDRRLRFHAIEVAVRAGAAGELLDCLPGEDEHAMKALVAASLRHGDTALALRACERVIRLPPGAEQASATFEARVRPGYAPSVAVVVLEHHGPIGIVALDQEWRTFAVSAAASGGLYLVDVVPHLSLVGVSPGFPEWRNASWTPGRGR